MENSPAPSNELQNETIQNEIVPIEKEIQIADIINSPHLLVQQTPNAHILNKGKRRASNADNINPKSHSKRARPSSSNLMDAYDDILVEREMSELIFSFITYFLIETICSFFFFS